MPSRCRAALEGGARGQCWKTVPKGVSQRRCSKAVREDMLEGGARRRCSTAVLEGGAGRQCWTAVLDIEQVGLLCISWHFYRANRSPGTAIEPMGLLPLLSRQSASSTPALLLRQWTSYGSGPATLLLALPLSPTTSYHPPPTGPAQQRCSWPCDGAHPHPTIHLVRVRASSAARAAAASQRRGRRRRGASKHLQSMEEVWEKYGKVWKSMEGVWESMEGYGKVWKSMEELELELGQVTESWFEWERDDRIGIRIGDDDTD
eukprot:gene15418-biopygen700